MGVPIVSTLAAFIYVTIIEKKKHSESQEEIGLSLFASVSFVTLATCFCTHVERLASIVRNFSVTPLHGTFGFVRITRDIWVYMQCSSF